MQAAAQSADSLGQGVNEAEVEVTSLSELGSLAIDALNLFIDNQDPPAAAAGAGSDSSKWAGAASEADSGPTLFPPSVIEHEDRDLELEEPFAGPTGLEYPGDTEIHPLDSPTAEGHPAPVDEHSLGNTQDTQPSPDQDHPVPEEATSASADAPNSTDQGDLAPAEEGPEEFVPPETLIAQASSTPNSPPLSTNNLFDPLGEDEESSAEDAVEEGIAQRIQEQYDLEAALEESARIAGVEPEPADLGVGEAAAIGAGKGERDRTRRRGCRAGAKHVAGRENLSYGQTCEYIRAQLGDSTYARFGRRFNLPHIPPHVARKQYPEWFGYVLRHSERWASDAEGELLPVDTITRWATILPELWQFLYSIDSTLLQGIPQPKYRLPRGYWSSDHPFVPLRHVRSTDTKVAPPRTVFNSGSTASSSAAPPRTDRSRSAAPKATSGSSSAVSAAIATAPWRPTLDRGQVPIVLTPRSQVEAKASKASAGKSVSKGIETKPESVAAGPKSKPAAASGAGASHSSSSLPVPPSPPPKVPPVPSPQAKGSTQVKAGATFVEVPKPSLPIRLPPPPKGPAPSPPTAADHQGGHQSVVPLEPPPSVPYGDTEPLDAPGPNEYSYRGPLKPMIPKWTRSNPEQIPVLRPVKAVPPVPPDADQLDMSALQQQDANLETLNNTVVHAKAHASSALGGAALRGELGQVLSHVMPENTAEEEEDVVVEEEEEEEGQGAASPEAPESDQDQPTTSAKAAASGAEPVRPVVMIPGPGAFIHRHLTPFRLRRTQWDREHEPSVPLEDAQDRVYDLDWSSTPQAEGDHLLPSSSTIHVSANADLYELDAEDSDNSDPEARSRRIRNLEDRTEDAGWLTWLEGHRPKTSQPSHPKPKLAEPASKRVRVVLTPDALKRAPPITPPHVRQVIIVPKNKPKGASVAAGPRVPVHEPQLSTATETVFVPSHPPQPPPQAREAAQASATPIAPPVSQPPVAKASGSQSTPPPVVSIESSSASPPPARPPSKARPVRSRSPPTKVKPPPPEARQLSAEAKRRAFEAFEERNRPVHVETDSAGKPLPAGARVPVGAGITAAAPSDPTPPGGGDDDQGEPSTPRTPKTPPKPRSPDRPPSQHATSGLPYKTPPGSLTGRSASWERNPGRQPEPAPPRPVTPKRKPPPPNPYPYPYGKPAGVPSVPHDTTWASQAASSTAAPNVLDNSWWVPKAASRADSHEEPPSGGRLAPHRPPSGSPASDTPRSVQPTTRYQPNPLPRLFGQQLANPHTLVPPQAGVFEVGLDWHKVLDTMLTPVRTPTNLLTDRLKQLESLPARITIISFTGAGDRYDSTIQEIDSFRDQCRASGCQMGGGFYLTNEKTGRGGKAELVSRLRIRAFMDDRADILAEIRRTGCFAMGYQARDYPTEPSGAIQVLTDYIWSHLAHWDAHHPLQAFVLQQYSGQGGRGGGRRRR